MKGTLIGNAVVLSLLMGGGEIVSAHKAIQSLDMEGMDLEANLMEIRAKRIQLLDKQLKGQTVVVEQKNQEMAVLKDQLTALQSEDTKQIEAIKAQLDAVSNSYQMEIEHLQSLKKKRREVLTNFMKTMQDRHSAIFGSIH
ncbi:hypothetical protein MHB42_19965 [Lysinibacillus sp. FSL K6-0232]|uniref:hypothetical protein n=1 Tax=unclassified Lysinibacillus TaxID=2636778 RepID=UPI0030F8E56E